MYVIFISIHFYSFLFCLLNLNKHHLTQNLKKSCGTDGISSFNQKKVFGSILEPLIGLFNDLLSSGNFPDTYKTTQISPIFKQVDIRMLPSNFPLCTISKVFEKVIYAHLNRHNIHVRNQVGIRPILNYGGHREDLQHRVSDLLLSLQS